MAVDGLLESVPLLGLLLIAVGTDLHNRRIPNWLTAAMIASGMARAAFIGGWSGACLSLAGAAAGAAIPFLLFALGALGGGDVKLLAGVGAWLGPREALAVFTLQCIVGLAIVLVQAVAQGRTLILFRNSALLVADISQKGLAASAPGRGGSSITSVSRPLPYAAPVAIATLMVIVGYGWM